MIEERESKEKEEQKKKKFKGKIWVPLLILFLAAGGGAFYYFTVYQGEGTADARSPAKFESVTLDSFLVNLSGGSGYLRSTITLEYVSGDTESELQKKEHRIRNVVIELLSRKTAADLADKDALRKELKNAINKVLDNEITGVYFREFVTQR